MTLRVEELPDEIAHVNPIDGGRLNPGAIESATNGFCEIVLECSVLALAAKKNRSGLCAHSVLTARIPVLYCYRLLVNIVSRLLQSVTYCCQ